MLRPRLDLVVKLVASIKLKNPDKNDLLFPVERPTAPCRIVGTRNCPTRS
jgi:hypothetical protein